MNREELLSEIQRLTKESKLHLKLYDELENEKNNLIKAVFEGTCFRPNELLAMIAHLMVIKEGKKYSFYVEKKYDYSDDKANDYTGYLINNDDNEKVVVYDNLFCFNKKDLDNNYILTYYFLQKRNNNYFSDRRINEVDFDKYPYIQDFICYLSDIQIERNEHLKFEEMISLVYDYLKFTKNKEISRQEIESTKPNTRILNKKD